MRKKIIGVVVLVGLLLVGKLIWNMNDISTIRHFAENGQYQTFYTKIKDKVEQHDSAAIEMLMEYFIQAVQNGTLEQVKYYLDQNKNLINMQSKEGARAVDALLVANEQVNLEMLNLLLSYHPALNYTVPYFKNMSPLQMISTNTRLSNGDILTKLFIDKGADVNFKSGNSPALTWSYVADNHNVFKILVNSGANLKAYNENNKDIIDYIKSSYLLELKKYFSELKLSYSKPLSIQEFNIIKSSSYRNIHSRNMLYLSEIFENNKIENLNTDSLNELAKYFAMSNEVTGLSLLMKQKLCSNYTLCNDLLQIAILNNNRAIIALIKEGE